MLLLRILLVILGLLIFIGFSAVLVIALVI